MFNLKILAAGLIFAAAESCGGAALMTSDTTNVQEAKVTEKTMSQTANTVTGVLTDQGVMCQAMQGDDGELYTFEVIPEGLQTGDRISVVKSTTNLAMMSTCDQGMVLHWDSISLLSSDGTSKNSWNYKDL